MSDAPSLNRGTSRKAETAFRTIGEVSTILGVQQHVLRYWETRFPQVKPLQRAGNRRYYRPADILLLQKIQNLLEREGYSIRGVQKLLSEHPLSAPQPEPSAVINDTTADNDLRDELIAIRQLLAKALFENGICHQPLSKPAIKISA